MSTLGICWIVSLWVITLVMCESLCVCGRAHWDSVRVCESVAEHTGNMCESVCEHTGNVSEIMSLWVSTLVMCESF